jgi:hypothetical protein
MVLGTMLRSAGSTKEPREAARDCSDPAEFRSIYSYLATDDI